MNSCIHFKDMHPFMLLNIACIVLIHMHAVSWPKIDFIRYTLSTLRDTCHQVISLML